MWMNDEPVFVPFISFLDSVLLTDIWCKFMLKNDIQNYFRKFTNILSENVTFREIKHTWAW